MKTLSILLAAAVLSSCAYLGIVDPGPEARATRNRCESMRSYRPYYPNECGELSGAGPYGYGAP